MGGGRLKIMMKKGHEEGQFQIQAIIGVTIAVIVVIIGFQIIYDVVSPAVEAQNYTENQSFVLNNTTGLPSHTSLTSVVNYNCTNGTERVMNGSYNMLTPDTDYVFLVSNYSIIASTGIWNSIDSENAYFLGCQYFDSNYLSDDAASRAVLTQVPVLMAVLGLIIVAALLMGKFRR